MRKIEHSFGKHVINAGQICRGFTQQLEFIYRFPGGDVLFDKREDFVTQVQRKTVQHVSQQDERGRSRTDTCSGTQVLSFFIHDTLSLRLTEDYPSSLLTKCMLFINKKGQVDQKHICKHPPQHNRPAKSPQ